MAFTKMDTENTGFLSLRDFHQSFARLFVAISNDDIRALFNEIDTDENGIVKYAEFENFYNANYIKKMADVEKERLMKNTQNEIFDHLIKVLI
jgi:Ca2+-binding EF-hand superfamily protein